MARFLAQTLGRDSRSLTLVRSSLSLCPSFLNHRRPKSDGPVTLIAIDLGSESEPDADRRDGERPEREDIEVHLAKLQDAIHGFIVRRSAPDWLPFIPGSSYWVPPVVHPMEQSSPKTTKATTTRTRILKEESPPFPYFAEGADALSQQIALFLSAKKGTSRYVKTRRSKKASIESDDDEE